MFKAEFGTDMKIAINDERIVINDLEIDLLYLDTFFYSIPSLSSNGYIFLSMDGYHPYSESELEPYGFVCYHFQLKLIENLVDVMNELKREYGFSVVNHDEQFEKDFIERANKSAEAYAKYVEELHKRRERNNK